MADEPRPTEQATVPETSDDDWGGLVTPEMARQNPVWRFLEDNYPGQPTRTGLVEYTIDDEAAISLAPTGPKTLLINSLRAFEKNTGAGTRALNLLSQQADEHGVSLEGLVHADPKFEKEGLSKADLLKFYQKAGWELRYPDKVRRGLSEGKAIEDIRVEMIRAPRPTDLVPVATDLVPLVVPPKEDPSQKKPKQTGKIWRGIGSMMRRRLVPIAQAAQLGWSALSDEQKGQVTEFLNNPIDFGLGRSEHPPGFKGGLDYFRQMLGMGPEQGGIASLPDLREPAPVYYSAVARAVDALPMERGAGEQMLAMISKSRGVKPEEMQWMDLPEFLRDKKSVTKQEIQDFVGANQLDIKEVVRSEGAMTDAFESSFAEGSIDTPDRQPLFEQYTLPGGKNYREVAFTLPGIAENFPGGHLKIPNTLAHVRLNDRTGPNGEKILFVEEIQSDWHKKGRTEGYKTSEFTNHNADIDGQVDDLMQRRTGINADLSENFNLGGTVLPDGNGVLWYSRDIIENNDFKNIGRIYENGSFYIDEGFSEANPAAAAKLKELAEIAAEVGNLNQSKRTGSMVPDAPLKKTWYEMVFRRIARMAAEGGYDSVAWTPGEVQAERYNLSKEVSTIEVTPMPDGTFKISPMLIDDDVPRVLHVEADQLDYTLGAELADKVRQQEERVAALGVEGLTRVYEGIDLKIGGEKLKGLYDGRIKNYASEFGKKFGARVGTTEIKPYDDGAKGLVRFEGTKVWNLPITPEMKEELLTQGIQKFAHGGFIDKPFYDRAV